MSDIRRGGHQARRLLRAAGLSADDRPVRPGLAGGSYRPLGDAKVLKIHRAAPDILAEIGIADAPDSSRDLLLDFGAELQINGRITFPRSLVEDVIARSDRRFVLHGQISAHDLEPWATRCTSERRGQVYRSLIPRPATIATRRSGISVTPRGSSMKDILATHHPRHISAEIQAEIRRSFPVSLEMGT